MTDTRTYLTRMVLFLVAIGIGVGLIARTLVPIFLVNPLLNGAILAVIAIGIALNIRQVIQIGPEARWLERFHAAANADAPADVLAEMRVDASVDNIKLLSPMARMLESKRGRGRITLSAQAMRTLLDGIAARLEEQGVAVVGLAGEGDVRVVREVDRVHEPLGTNTHEPRPTIDLEACNLAAWRPRDRRI